MTLETIRAWLGSTRATIVPVLDLGRGDAEDEHDPPSGCGRASSCGVDHIESYVDPDDGGAPARRGRPTGAGATGVSVTAPTPGAGPAASPSRSPATPPLV
jgi:hypothetical protein